MQLALRDISRSAAARRIRPKLQSQVKLGTEGMTNDDAVGAAIVIRHSGFVISDPHSIHFRARDLLTPRCRPPTLPVIAL